MSCDLENAYLNAPCREKIWFEGGAECSEDQGKVLVVVRAYTDSRVQDHHGEQRLQK